METKSKLQQEMEASVKNAFQQGKRGHEVNVKDLPNGNPVPVKQFKDMTDVEKTKLAMEAIRTQPGRLPRDLMIKKLTMEKGMTRAQAKEEIKRFDTYMVTQFLAQMEKTELSKSVQPAKVKPLVSAVFRGMGYQV